MTDTDPPDTSAVPTPKSVTELVEYLDGLVQGELTYDTSADALWRGALATFNYLAREMGNTGFQASWAALHFLAHANGIEGPFAVIRAERLLYPQYDVVRDVEEYINKWSPWATEQARERLRDDTKAECVHPDVWAHWLELVPDEERSQYPTAAEVASRFNARMAILKERADVD